MEADQKLKGCLPASLSTAQTPFDSTGARPPFGMTKMKRQKHRPFGQSVGIANADDSKPDQLFMAFQAKQVSSLGAETEDGPSIVT